MTCSTCGSANPDHAKFCIACGQPLPRVCPACGALNPPGARFCNQCGTALGSGASAPGLPTSAPTASAPTGGEGMPADAPHVGTAWPRPETAPRPAGPAHGETGDEHTEQRRIVTVLFADLTSSTALADSMDPEDVRTLLAGFFATIAREIHRHGGTVEKYIGDAVMAVFGMPQAHEDDPVRAVRAAFGMQAALRRFNDERRLADPTAADLRMRIGINTGEVVAASGMAEGRDFLITGDPVNVAARLQQSAMPGSILVGPRTFRGTSGAVVYRALAPISLRGKPRPIYVWEAVALAEQGDVPMPRPRGVRGLRAPLVGRDVELNLLRTVYSRVASERRPHLVTIVGVPGVGKTRLAREFLDGVRAAEDEPAAPLMLEGRCPLYGEGITYWPLAEMLRTHCGFSVLDRPEVARAKLADCVRDALLAADRPDDPEVLAAYLGHTIGVETVERRQALLPSDSLHLQEGMLRAWRVFFEALATGRSLLVLVDDIHWADDTLLDLLEYVATRATGVALLLLCPARPELLEKRPDWGGGKRNYVMLGLEALSARDTERLVRALLPGDEVPESLRRGILKKAEGNPFFVEEIVRMLVDRGILVSNDPAPGWRVASEWEESDEVFDPAIPDTVQGVIAARLDLLTDAERDVLQHAAVIGRYFWPGALRSLHPQYGDEDLRAVLDALRCRDLIRESERPEVSIASAGEPLYTFNHALIREVTYAGIPRTRRAHEHEHVAEWLERIAPGREAEFADLLAQHYRQYYTQANLSRSRSGVRRLAVRDKVVRYLTLAGDQAAAHHASAAAESYYTDALELLADDALPGDVPRLVDLYTQRGDAHWTQVHGDEAWADYRAALRLWLAHSVLTLDGVLPAALPDGDDPPATAQADTRGMPPFAEAGLALPLDWRSRGLRLYRQLVLLPSRYASFFQQPPAHEELLEYLRAGLRLAEELGQSDTLEGAELLTAKTFLWWSWPERRGEAELLDALRSAREAVRITEALADPHAASVALDALGNMQAVTTDLRGNLESQVRRLQWARQLDDTNELVDIYAEVCTAYMLVGEYGRAIELGQVALELAAGTDTAQLQLRALRVLVLAYFEWDHWPETVRLGEQLAVISRYPGVTHSGQQRWALLALAIAYARMGRRDEADRTARRVSELPDRAEAQYIGLFKARLALARGAMKEARQTLLAAVEARSGRMSLSALLAELAELGARSGDAALCERFGPQALELGWRSGARKALAQAIRARGVVAVAEARWDDALADLQSALSRYRELGTAWEEARTRYALAGCYRRRDMAGDEALAREELTRALELFVSLGAVRDIARARAALAGADVRLP